MFFSNSFRTVIILSNACLWVIASFNDPVPINVAASGPVKYQEIMDVAVKAVATDKLLIAEKLSFAFRVLFKSINKLLINSLQLVIISLLFFNVFSIDTDISSELFKSDNDFLKSLELFLIISPCLSIVVFLINVLLKNLVELLLIQYYYQ